MDGAGGFGALIFIVEVATAGAEEVNPNEVLEDLEFVALASPWWGGVGFLGFVCVAGPFLEDVH